MKKYLILLIIPLLLLTSCLKDTSAYLAQEKESVTVDKIDPDNPSGGIPEGSLAPGIHLIKQNVIFNGVSSERKFKYFMPVSIDKTKPISLIFDFHGSYSAGANPIENIALSHPLNQLAIKENCIIVFPAGEDTADAVNWQNTEYHLPFVDSMVNYFNTHTPVIDNNRIYTSGHSSGAIFSFALAYYRSNIFAAAVPVSGQMKISGIDYPSKAVPIRAFNGVADNIVIHSAALNNITTWANLVAGYFASDAMVSDTLSIDNYKKYITTKWNGGKSDIEFYSIIEEGHSVSWNYILPLMWDFMKTHIKGTASTALYFSSELKSIDAMCGQSFSGTFNFSQGATLSLVTHPSDWVVTLANNMLSVTAPTDYFAPTTLNRKGSISIKAELNGASKIVSIPYTLQAPKTYFEVGDIQYDSNYNVEGIVFWVNPYNVKEAKIIALDQITRKFGPVGASFFTPDMNDGYNNTLALIQRVASENLSLTSATSAFIYAYEYKSTPGNTSGWYLPAVDELKALDANFTDVDNALKNIGGTPIETKSSSGSYYLTSTSYNGGTASSPNKKFYTYDFNVNPSWHGYYVLTQRSDDTSYVTTRPIKKVTK